MKHLCIFLCLLSQLSAFSQNTYVPGGNAAILNSNNGYMGIGNAAPAARLHVQQGNQGWADGLRLSYGGRNWNFVLDNNGDRFLLTKDESSNGITLFNGNTGINVTNPANKLQIGPNPHGWSANDLVISNASGSLAIHNDASHTYLYGTGNIAIRPGFGQMAVYAHSSGNVGIRSTNPQGSLQVGDYRPVIIKSNGGNGVYGSEIGFNAVLNTSVVPNTLRKLGGSSQNGGASIAVDYSGNMLFQMFNGNTESEVTTNYSPQVTFSNLGNIGVGTTTANAKLKVFNTAAYNLAETLDGQDHIVLSANDPGNGGLFGGLTWESGGRRRASIAATREHSDADYVGIAFFTKGVDGPGPIAESMRITRNGNVGIGTSSPDATLAVKGDIHTREVRVDMNGSVGPDYVFDANYPLLSLAELEKYIAENKHLPEIPSAKQMEENGLLLKEMNLLLLKKVEELTLHVIALKKENEAQQRQIGELKRN